MRPSSVLQQLNSSDDNDTNVTSTINDSPSAQHQHEPAEPLKREDGIFVQHNGIVILQTDDFICPLLTISTNVRHRFIAIKNFSPKLKQDQAKETHRT